MFTLPKPRTKDTRNLGALSTTLNRWLLVAHHYNRVLIFDDPPWKLAECPSRSWECYFRPLSRCRTKDVLASTPKDQVAFHGSNKAPLPNARVVRVKQTWWKVIDWEKTARDTLGSGLLTGDLFRAGLEYLLRMNDAMRADVERGLRLSLYDDGDAGDGAPGRGRDHAWFVSPTVVGASCAAALEQLARHMEAVLGTHPAVAQVAIVPRPDPIMGEVGVAIVVPTDPTRPPALDDLLAHAAGDLSGYKLPTVMRVVDALPLNAGDKLDRRGLALRERREASGA